MKLSVSPSFRNSGGGGTKHSLIAHKQNEGEAIEVDGIGWQHLQLKPFKLNGTYTFVFSCHTFSQSTTPT